MKTVFVTGADGFIGSHLTERLVRDGYRVRALAQYNSFNSWGWLDHAGQDIQGHFEVVTGDVRDAHGIMAAMRDCDAILHLAALIAIPFSYHSPDMYVETNVRGTLNVLQAARALGIGKVVHTSTSEVYGSARYVPIDEGHPLQGQSPYSASKIGADQLAFAFHSSFEMDVITVRPFNTYGPRQSARAFIPTVITQVAAGARDIRLGSLNPTRDFTYVSDTVAGFVAALEASEVSGEVFNLGTNFEVTMGQTAAMIAEIMGVEVTMLTDEGRLRPAGSEVDRLWSNNEKAKSTLGWLPELVGLEGMRIGLARTIEWFLDPVNLSGYKSDRYNI